MRLTRIVFFLALAVPLAASAEQSATDYLERGLTLYAEGKLDEAIASYRKAIELQPRDADAHYHLGRALHDKGELDEAIASYESALALRPQVVGVQRARMALALHLGEAAAEGPPRALGGLVAQFKDDNLTFADLLPGGPESFVQPELAVPYNHLGSALLSKGEMAEAIAWFITAIKLQPDLAEAHNNMGRVLQDLGVLDEAIASYRKAVELQPEFAEAQNNLEAALRDAAKEEEARRELGKPRLTNDGAPPTASAMKEAMDYLIRGHTQQMEGQLDEAIASYRKAIELYAAYTQAHISLPEALLRKGELDEAITAYRQAIALSPPTAPDFGHEYFYGELGRALLKNGELDESIEAFRKAIELQPRDADAYFIAIAHHDLGEALREAGQEEEAQRHLDEARRLGYKPPE